MFRDPDPLEDEKGKQTTLSPLPHGSALSADALPDGVKPTENGLTSRDMTLDDPFDLYPVREILGRCCHEELSACASEQPLVILMGESHAMPTHKMTQCGALSHIAAMRDADLSRSILFAYEHPYNDLASRAKHKYSLSGIPEKAFYASGHDPDGYLGVRSILAKNRFTGAPLSMERVFQSAIYHNLQTLFNDCAEQGNIIDPKDPLLPKFENELLNDFKAAEIDLGMLTPYGLAVRNLSMVRRALDRVVSPESKLSPVIIQQCGLAHICGYREGNYEFRHSLTAQYKAAGARVLPVFITSESDDYTPESIVEGGAASDIWTGEFSNALILRGLDESRHYDDTNEAGYLNMLENAYGRSAGGGLTAPFYHAQFPPLPDYKETKDEIRAAFGLKPPFFERMLSAFRT